MNALPRIAAAACLLALFTGSGIAAPDGSAIGLWCYRTSFATGLAGELAIAHKGRQWHAALGNATADATTSAKDVRLVFPAEGGTFRGTFEHGVLRGFWIRRAATDDPRYPSGEALSYAGPLALRAAGTGRWRATVTPLEDTFTLYLKIFRDSDGALKAAFRNPEQNSHGDSMQYTALQTGDILHLSAQPDPAKPAVHLDANLLHNPDRIAVVWSDLGKSIELSRTAPDEAVRFFPRPPGAAPYVYREPEATHDGWKVARAGNVGMDETALARVAQRIDDIDPASAHPWMIHSLAIAYRGKLVLDEYFYGAGRNEPHDTRSASKTFSSVMLGALMMEGANVSPETKVYDAMAPLGPFANPDPRKSKITLGHLLTHSAGLACDDNADSSPGNEDTIEADRAHPDWAKITLDLPMQFEPGAHYAYCSMHINLAGAVLSRVSGEWLPALFDRTVARPLQFGPYYWNLMGNGEGYQGGGVFVRPRDFLKLGQTFLDGGVWNGRRIVSAAWVKDSLAPHAHISPATTGLEGDAFREVYWETDEGYAWHMINVKSGDRLYPAYDANGNGGQLLIVVPQFDLAAMFTAGNYQQGLWNRERDDILGDMIIPAIESGTAAPPAGH
jgi:CubicO group peptidase (beta-lactamase class C family)